MTVLEYMAQQKAKIRARHSGEEFFFQSGKDKNAPVKLDEHRAASVILEEMEGLKGLNTAARRFYSLNSKFTAKSGFVVYSE